MNYIISFFIVLLLVVIFILSFLLFKEKFDTEIPLYTGATESSDKSDNFLTAIGITDPTSQILISNSNGDLSLLPLLTLKKGIDTVSQDDINKNNGNYYIKDEIDDKLKSYTTTADLPNTYIQKGIYYSLSNEKAAESTVHYDWGKDKTLKGDGATCQYDHQAYNFKFDEPCPDKP
jgi:flagellar basal body-associated protein FliL